MFRLPLIRFIRFLNLSIIYILHATDHLIIYYYLFQPFRVAALFYVQFYLFV